MVFLCSFEKNVTTQCKYVTDVIILLSVFILFFCHNAFNILLLTQQAAELQELCQNTLNIILTTLVARFFFSFGILKTGE